MSEEKENGRQQAFEAAAQALGKLIDEDEELNILDELQNDEIEASDFILGVTLASKALFSVLLEDEVDLGEMDVAEYLNFVLRVFLTETIEVKNEIIGEQAEMIDRLMAQNDELLEDLLSREDE